MLNRIKNIILWSSIIIYIIVILGFISDESDFIRCKNININIESSDDNHFIENSDVMNIFKKNDFKVLGYPFDSINGHEMEKIIRKSPSIKSAEVYKTIDGSLNIDITQRRPLVRIINYNNESYYIDDEGALMPLSNKYTARVLIVNGKINEPYSLRYTEHLTDSNENKSLLLYNIYKLAEYINSNPFWNAQIQQVYINDNEEFELVPKVGDHIIIFGNIENYKEKFENLMLVYKVGLRNKGWNDYSEISLKYRNQVVCTKKISSNE